MMKRTIFFISLLFVVFIVAGLSQEKNPEIIAIKIISNSTLNDVPK